jgi:very-short-patch-repair endonuclease
MSRTLTIPAALIRAPFTRATALQHITVNQLRHPAYRLITQGVYMVGRPGNHGDLIRAARLVLPASAVLAGRSALWALGVLLAGTRDPVEVVLPATDRIRRRDLLTVRSDSLDERRVIATRHGRATDAAQTAFDLARGADPLISVPLLDALVRRTGVARHHIEAVAAAHAGARWISRIPPTLDLVDPGAESVRESQLRVTLVLAGLPRPQTQVKIFNAEGQFVGRVDLGWPELKVAVEYDGAYHDDPAQFARDRARLNALRAAGWTVIVIDRAQFARPADVVALISRVLMAASRP